MVFGRKPSVTAASPTAAANGQQPHPPAHSPPQLSTSPTPQQFMRPASPAAAGKINILPKIRSHTSSTDENSSLHANANANMQPGAGAGADAGSGSKPSVARSPSRSYTVLPQQAANGAGLYGQTPPQQSSNHGSAVQSTRHPLTSYSSFAGLSELPQRKTSAPELPSALGAASATPTAAPRPRASFSQPGAPGVTLHDTSDFGALDDQLLNSSTYKELYRIVRLAAAQPSCDKIVDLIEQQCRPLINATGVRLWLVQRDGLVHHSSSKTHPINCGLVGYVRNKREVLNLSANITGDSRYDAEIDNPFQTQTKIESGDGHIASPTAGISSVHAMIVVPIEADSHVAGQGPKDVVAVLQAYRAQTPGSNTTAGTFQTSDCKVLYRLGEFIGNMLRNSRSVERQHAIYQTSLQNTKRSAAILDVARALASATQLDAVVGVIVSQVPELLDCDRCTLYFVDKPKEQLIVTKGASKGRTSGKSLVSWVFGTSNAPELPFTRGSDELRFSMHSGIAGHVATSGQTVNIVDAHTDSRFNSTVDKETGYRTRSLLCVPMNDASGECIGVLQAINKTPLVGKFDTSDVELLHTFSAQAALAVRNSQLYMQTKAALNQSDALLSVTQALSSELKIEALIGIICNQVQKLMNAERCTVFIVDDRKKSLYTSDSMTFGMGPSLPIDQKNQTVVYFPMDRGIAGAVATSGQIVNIVDAYKDSRFNQKFDKETGFRTRAILCMPIVNHKQVIVGVLQVMNKRIATTSNSTSNTTNSSDDSEYIRFDEGDEKILRAFCSQASIAIENSRLYTETEKALNHALADQRNLRFMLSVTKNLFSDMHLTSMVNQLTMQVHHLLKADDCALYLLSDDGKDFYLAKDEDNPTAIRYPLGTGIAGHVAKTGETIRINKAAHADKLFNAAVDQRKNKTTHSILCCPIVAELSNGKGQSEGTKIVGVISVRDEKDRGGFEAEEQKLLAVFCAQASVGIVNAKKYDHMLESSSKEFRAQTTETAYAMDFLVENRGMKLATTDVDRILYTMADIQLKGAIGTGSYGEVYKAIVNNQVVAVKKLHVKQLKAEQLDSFCSEASLMCQLHHENIVAFIGAVTEPSNLCIITQFCHRGSLADLLLDPSVQMTYYMKLQFALQSAVGMVYLHNSNPVILHRDLKSDNILVTNEWTCKVGDFGLTRFISDKKQMTQVGTPMWMAPEIIMGKKYTEKADVYAFGIILWEIMTRLEPYEDKEPMQIVVEVVNENLRPIIPSQYTTDPLLPLMKDCWHSDPEQRPSFEKVVDRLKVIIANEPIDDLTKKLMNAKI